MVVAAGIERENLALAPRLLRGRAVEARSRRDQAVVEGEPADRLLAAQRLRQLALGGAGPVVGNHGQHGIDDRLGRDAELTQLLGRLHGAQPLEHEHAVGDLAIRERAAQRRVRIDRQEAELRPDAARLHA